jgi:hypothetical protein
MPLHTPIGVGTAKPVPLSIIGLVQSLQPRKTLIWSLLGTTWKSTSQYAEKDDGDLLGPRKALRYRPLQNASMPTKASENCKLDCRIPDARF